MLYKNVMVIDDSYFDRLIAEKVMQISRYAENVLTVDSVLKAMDYLKTVRPDDRPEIIFLDINMPEIDGFGFLDRFKDLPKSIKENCKIFMLSSSIDPEDIKKARKSSYVFDFISKPLTKEKLPRL